jgi:DDE_Tnp_1-associated
VTDTDAYPPPCDSLLAAFARLTDPRHRRGIRHPVAGLLALTFLGLLCRHADFAAIARWAQRHWDQLRAPLGVTRRSAPHATTLSRAAACDPVAEFRAALADGLAGAVGGGDLAAAVDGTTRTQARGGDGDPIHVLNVFAHGAKLCLADWPRRRRHGDRTGGPQGAPRRPVRRRPRTAGADG